MKISGSGTTIKYCNTTRRGIRSLPSNLILNSLLERNTN
jgi:hypothetical protein